MSRATPALILLFSLSFFPSRFASRARESSSAEFLTLQSEGHVEIADECVSPTSRPRISRDKCFGSVDSRAFSSRDILRVWSDGYSSFDRLHFFRQPFLTPELHIDALPRRRRRRRHRLRTAIPT